MDLTTRNEDQGGFHQHRDFSTYHINNEISQILAHKLTILEYHHMSGFNIRGVKPKLEFHYQNVRMWTIK